MIKIRNTNEFVGTGLFPMSTFFYKGVKKGVAEHNFDPRLVEAFEFVAQLFYGYKGVSYPYVTSSVRFPVDSNYYVGNSKRKGLSNHSRAKAEDINWHDRDVEAEIVQIIGYDLTIGGIISEKLKSIGINGYGTYYHTSYGTFIHLDTGDKFNHYMKLPHRLGTRPFKLHQKFMQWISQREDKMRLFDDVIYAPQTQGPWVDGTEWHDTPTSTPTSSAPTSPLSVTPKPMPTLQAYWTDMSNWIKETTYGVGEDPVDTKSAIKRWVEIILVIIVVAIIGWAAYKYL